MHNAHQRISVEQAARLIGEHMPHWPAVRLPLRQAVNAVLRETISAERDQPPFDRVTMDGIALRHAALAAGRRSFRVAGTQAAGASALTLASDDECIEVMTGGVLPHGTDSVVPVERTRRSDGHVEIETGYTAVPGQCVHRRGSDHRQGEPLLTAGTVIGAPEMAALTVGGEAEIQVTRWPRIGVVSTGDELVEPGAPIEPFQIRSSNDLVIETALRQRGFPSVHSIRLRDEPALLTREIGRLHAECDVIILSGGVSMGQFDHVPGTLAALGVRAVFHKVTQRPGLPLWFGTDADGKAVFGLPGNPVSTLVCLVRYVLPGLAAAMGAMPREVPRVRLAEPVEFRPDLTYFLPAILQHAADGAVRAAPRPTNTSGDFVALAGTDGFLELARGQDLYPAGYAAPFFRW